MKQLSILLIGFVLCVQLTAQPNAKQYDSLVKRADSFYSVSDYRNAVAGYEAAFISTGGMGKVRDRYKAATCYTLTGAVDQAFEQLTRIVTKGGFSNEDMLVNDGAFKMLHADARWKEIITVVRENKKKKSAANP